MNLSRMSWCMALLGTRLKKSSNKCSFMNEVTLCAFSGWSKNLSKLYWTFFYPSLDMLIVSSRASSIQLNWGKWCAENGIIWDSEYRIEDEFRINEIKKYIMSPHNWPKSNKDKLIVAGGSSSVDFGAKTIPISFTDKKTPLLIYKALLFSKINLMYN